MGLYHTTIDFSDKVSRMKDAIKFIMIFGPTELLNNPQGIDRTQALQTKQEELVTNITRLINELNKPDIALLFQRSRTSPNTISTPEKTLLLLYRELDIVTTEIEYPKLLKKETTKLFSTLRRLSEYKDITTKDQLISRLETKSLQGTVPLSPIEKEFLSHSKKEKKLTMCLNHNNFGYDFPGLAAWTYQPDDMRSSIQIIQSKLEKDPENELLKSQLSFLENHHEHIIQLGSDLITWLFAHDDFRDENIMFTPEETNNMNQRMKYIFDFNQKWPDEVVFEEIEDIARYGSRKISNTHPEKEAYIQILENALLALRTNLETILTLFPEVDLSYYKYGLDIYYDRNTSEARNRVFSFIPTLTEYADLRYGSSAVIPCLANNLLLLQVKLKSDYGEIFSNIEKELRSTQPLKMINPAVLHISYWNDFISADKEQQEMITENRVLVHFFEKINREPLSETDQQLLKWLDSSDTTIEVVAGRKQLIQTAYALIKPHNIQSVMSDYHSLQAELSIDPDNPILTYKVNALSLVLTINKRSVDNSGLYNYIQKLYDTAKRDTIHSINEQTYTYIRGLKDGSASVLAPARSAIPTSSFSLSKESISHKMKLELLKFVNQKCKEWISGHIEGWTLHNERYTNTYINIDRDL